MSNIDCGACNDLREYAPHFVQNGVTDTECTSLQNDTGLNPALTVLHSDCEDLNDVNDCLVGRMDGELEAYETCDWKKFMHKYIPNVYETIKGIICAICGLWTNIHSILASIERICYAIDGLLGLIRGGGGKQHKGEWTEVGDAKFIAHSQFDDEKFFPSLVADIREGYGCTSGKKMAVYNVYWIYDEYIYPREFSFRVENLQKGDIIATFKKSDVVPNDMPESIWNSIMRGYNNFQYGIINYDTILFVGLKGYIVIDGVEFNADLKEEYGEDVMVMYINSMIGDSNSGGFWGKVGPMVTVDL